MASQENGNKRMTKEQQRCLLEAILRNPEMVNGNSMLQVHRRLWAEVTETLNAMGVKKTQKDWFETYKLLARKTKLKLRKITKEQQRTGGGPPKEPKLTDAEDIVVTIEGWSSIVGLRGTTETRIQMLSQNEPVAGPSSMQQQHDRGVSKSEMTTPLHRKPGSGERAAEPSMQWDREVPRVTFTETLEAIMEVQQDRAISPVASSAQSPHRQDIPDYGWQPAGSAEGVEMEVTMVEAPESGVQSAREYSPQNVRVGSPQNFGTAAERSPLGVHMRNTHTRTPRGRTPHGARASQNSDPAVRAMIDGAARQERAIDRLGLRILAAAEMIANALTRSSD